MNKKINWYEVSIDFISGVIVGVFGFVAFFFMMNLSDFLLPVGKSVLSSFTRGVIMGLVLGRYSLRHNNIFLTGLGASVILLTFLYSNVFSKIIAFPFSSFDTILFVNSFVVGLIIATVIGPRIKEKKPEIIKENTTTN